MIAFLNLFTVPAGREEDFLDLWTTVNRHMVTRPGYVDHRLHRSIDPGAPYRFVNLAHWESTEAWRSAHDEDFRALVTSPAWAAFGSTPALYEAAPVHHG